MNEFRLKYIKNTGRDQTFTKFIELLHNNEVRNLSMYVYCSKKVRRKQMRSSMQKKRKGKKQNEQTNKKKQLKC